MKPLILPTILALSPFAARAASMDSQTFVINTPIPDNSGIGLSDTRQFSSLITAISEVNVQLTMSGGWTGDLYAYLTHGSGFAVLLNRPGRTLEELAGSGVSTLSITLADNAGADVHTGIPISGGVSGFFQPDAREIDPDNSLDGSPRTAFLSSFDGLDANGYWTLYVADVATGDTMILNDWTLTVTGVPEPSVTLLCAAGACLALRRRRA